MTADTRSARQVPRAPVSAVAAAARYVEREWGDRYTIGYAGTHNDGSPTTTYVFQACAADGSRFLVWADRYENVGDYPPAIEAQVGAELDVEVSGYVR